MILLARSGRAESPALPSCPPVSGQTPAGEALPCLPAAREGIGDVALGPGGVLEGRVLCGREETAWQPAAGLRLALVRGGRTVAETTTDTAGRFRLSHRSGRLPDHDAAGWPRGSRAVAFSDHVVSPGGNPHGDCRRGNRRPGDLP